MPEKIDLHEIVSKANFAESSDPVTKHTGIPRVIEGLPLQFYWLIGVPSEGSSRGEDTEIAVFDPTKGVSSLRVYHFSQRESHDAIMTGNRIRLESREPLYAGEAALEYLASSR